MADGAVQTIADAAGVPRGAAWGSRDVIVFSVGTPPQLARVAARGGEVTELASTSEIFAAVSVLSFGWPPFPLQRTGAVGPGDQLDALVDRTRGRAASGG